MCSFSSIFYAVSISDTCLRSQKSNSIPNFDKISQSMAEIKLLPDEENGRPPYCNFTADFDFDMCIHRHVILPAKVRSNRRRSYGVISIFQYGGHRVGNLLQVSDGTCLGRWKSICIPNFDEISQSTANIKLLPVSENGMPPYWNSIFVFLHMCIDRPVMVLGCSSVHAC